MSDIIDITHGAFQTKHWRKNQKWYINGKKNECELYQKRLLNVIVPYDILPTKDRINLFTYNICNDLQPMKKLDGYEWSETFDGKLIINDITYYFNLKFVCDSGGAQTRTLRECYHFIYGQLMHEINKKSDITHNYYINIFDGDECYKNMKKFKYLISKKVFKDIRKYFYVGCMYDFVDSNIAKNTFLINEKQCDTQD